MRIWDLFLVRGRLPLSSFLCFVGGFSMGSWLTLFNQVEIIRLDELERSKSNDLNNWNNGLSMSAPILNILILSGPNNYELREVARNTWLKLNTLPSKVRHYFLIGTLSLSEEELKKLEKEDFVHQDIMFLHELFDSYNNLTLKVSLGLQTMYKKHPSKFVLKCDDDSFIRLDKLIEELEDLKWDKISNKCFYWGYFDGRSKVKTQGKWKETEVFNLCDNYLPYALGGGYVLSSLCVQYIVSNLAYLHKYTNEDATIGTWLAPIHPLYRHDRRFDTQWESRGCNNLHLIEHSLNVHQILERYNNLKSFGKLCTQESRRRPSYEYNWTVPPSKCCNPDPSLLV